MDSNQRPLHFQRAALTTRLSLKPPGDCKLTLKYKATATVQPDKHTRNGLREYACTQLFSGLVDEYGVSLAVMQGLGFWRTSCISPSVSIHILHRFENSPLHI